MEAPDRNGLIISENNASKFKTAPPTKGLLVRTEEGNEHDPNSKKLTCCIANLTNGTLISHRIKRIQKNPLPDTSCISSGIMTKCRRLEHININAQ